jgi:hypothetical protein
MAYGLDTYEKTTLNLAGEPLTKKPAMHDKKPRMIHPFTDAEIQNDLEKYRQMALELGMTNAAIIPAEKVHVDKRIRAKCIIPKCPAYGCSAHCPPHSPETKEIAEIVSGFRWAVLVKLNVDSELVGGDDSLVLDDEGNIVQTSKMKKLRRLGRGPWRLKKQ